ncbi:MAG: hypothetical protein M1831_005125 [Alyxoria varia]|nr:MAG: hypothetical protein M1831_005125 [Alyxoria varia]
MGEWYARESHSSSTPMIEFKPGQAKPAGEKYGKTLVVTRVKDEAVDWMNRALPDIEKAIYVADDPTAPLHPPKNKGHEVMVYLTYIIDNYDNLPDVVIFMHAHQYSWHNADIFGNDAAEMIKRLNPARVWREGFMNMRCQWHPGCPDWMHPGATEEDEQKMEEVLIAKAWAELFPSDPVPELLATPCCSQFAISRERLHAVPQQTYVYYRDWMLHTPLKDFVSGRVWEYLWQKVFTGEASWCPKEHVCFCDGFGVCFENEDAYGEWYNMRNKRDDANGKWLEWEDKAHKIKKLLDEGKKKEADEAEKPEPGKDQELKKIIDATQAKMDEKLDEAKKRGGDPEARAKVLGRPWKEGDGF